MRVKERPVAAGMQWNAKASRSEFDAYETRKNSVQNLRERSQSSRREREKEGDGKGWYDAT